MKPEKICLKNYFFEIFLQNKISDKYFDMDKQRLYENIMRDLRDVFSSLMNEDVLDDLDRIDSGKTSVEKILDMSPIVFKRYGKYIEMQLSDDENKNEIMRLVGDRFQYDTIFNDDVIDIDDFLFEDREGEYKMWLYLSAKDFMSKRWCKGRIFAHADYKFNKHSQWIVFKKDESDGKWYAICNERNEKGGRYRILNI